MTQNADVRYHRFVMFADPKLGQASLSWRVKECLEAAGHTVLWFEPRLQPHAFARAGVVRAYMARAFLESQRPDCVVLADGLEPDYPADLAASAGSPVGALCEGAAAAAGCASRAASGGWSPDFAAVCGEGALEALSAGVTCVCDISDTGASCSVMSKMGLRGIVYREVGAMDKRRVDDAMRMARNDIARWSELIDSSRMKVGIAPRETYDCHPLSRLYRKIHIL